MLAALALVAIGGCGGGEDSAELEKGKQVFADAGCGRCHTLGEAGTTGKIGPNLDQIGPGYPQVVAQVTDGGPGMPAFADKLSEDEIAAVASYVSEVAGSSLAVASRFKPDDTSLADCSGRDQLCYEQAFANLAFEEGPADALASLSQTMEQERTVATGCHRIAHAMGNGALARLDGDVGRAFAQGGRFGAVCSSGYYHGILEHAFAGVDDDQLGEKAAELCKSVRDPFLAFQCKHGLGHGLMITTDYELPVALDTCDALPQADRTTCYDGVFMENFNSSYGVESEWLRDDDLIYPCNSVEEGRKHSCYIIVTARILPEVGFNWRKAAETCREAEPDWQYICFRSFGRDAISMNAYDQDTARQLCHLTGDMEVECVLSVALHIANEERSLEGAGRFCRETEPAMRGACFAGVGSTAALIYPDPKRREEACSRETANRTEQFACSTGQIPPV